MLCFKSTVKEQLVLALGYTTSLLVLDTSLRLPDPRSHQLRSAAYDVVAGREKRGLDLRPLSQYVEE